MGRSYPRGPIPAVGAVVIKGGDVLLIVRGKAPGYGQWSIPGGAILLGETQKEAVTREIREEVGILVEPIGLVKALDRIVHDEKGKVLYHYVLLDYLCLYHSGNLRVGSDAMEARWVKASDIGRYGLPRETEEVIKEGLKMARSQSERHSDK